VSVYVSGTAQPRGIGATCCSVAPSSGGRRPLELATLVAFVFGHNEAEPAAVRTPRLRAMGRLPRVARLDGVERDL
jgi:phosphinothricin acetyltransferase